MTKKIPATGRYGIELPEVMPGAVSVWVEEDGSLSNNWQPAVNHLVEQQVEADLGPNGPNMLGMAIARAMLTQAWIDSREPDQPL